MIELLGLGVRIAGELIVEVIWAGGPSDRREYRDYVRTMPPSEIPLSRREWRAAQRANRSS